MNTRDRSRVKQLVVSGDCLTHMFTTGEKRSHRIINGLPVDAELVYAEYNWFPCELRLTYWSASFPAVPQGCPPERLNLSVVMPVYTNEDVVLDETERTPPTPGQRAEMKRLLGVDPASGSDESVEVLVNDRGMVFAAPTLRGDPPRIERVDIVELGDSTSEGLATYVPAEPTRVEFDKIVDGITTRLRADHRADLEREAARPIEDVLHPKPPKPWSPNGRTVRFGEANPDAPHVVTGG